MYMRIYFHATKTCILYITPDFIYIVYIYYIDTCIWMLYIVSHCCFFLTYFIKYIQTYFIFMLGLFVLTNLHST